MKNLFLCVVALCAVGLVLALIWLVAAVGERTVVSATDPGSGCEFRVTSRPHTALGGITTTLYVDTGSSVLERCLDSEAAPGAVLLVRYQQWVLVIVDGYVWGGYDTQTGAILGQGQWDKLPFNVWHGSGTVLAQGEAAGSCRSPGPCWRR